MAEIHHIKYFNKTTLTEANDFAIANDLNRSLVPEKVSALSDDLRFPIVEAFEHNGDHLRVGLLLNQDVHVWLDISFEQYEDLPVMQLEEPSIH